MKQYPMKLIRWVVLIIPVFFCGCFDSQSKTATKSNESGIALIDRFFGFDQESSTEKLSDEKLNTAVPEYAAGFAAIPELEDAAGYMIAMPAFVGTETAGLTSAHETKRTGNTALSTSRSTQASSLRNAVSLVFNAPFNQIFLKVFRQTKSEDAAIALDSAAQSIKEELPNPFTEAIQKKSEASNTDADASANETTKVAENNTDATDKSNEKDSSNSKDSSKSDSGNAIAPAGSGNAFSSGYLIVGDFDGTGVLKTIAAQRSTETHFVSADGERDFSLYINSDAVALGRSFYVDDIDMDGNSDILVSNTESLFGGVFLGDSAGSYRYAAKFVTGYESAIMSAGPLRNGMREIIAVSPRTGSMRTFLYTEKYRILQESKLGFAPNYLLHLVSAETSLDFVMAAQIKGMEQILEWQDNGQAQFTTQQLGVDATVLNLELGSYSLVGYQVDQYASILLTSEGKTFNVANMKLMPKTYLVIGDLKGKGTLDVAVAGLKSFSPAK
jgi:hypothetical protein